MKKFFILLFVIYYYILYMYKNKRIVKKEKISPEKIVLEQILKNVRLDMAKVNDILYEITMKAEITEVTLQVIFEKDTYLQYKNIKVNPKLSITLLLYKVLANLAVWQVILEKQIKKGN